ncbi:hypothetical protein [Pseudoroseomonas cervicalis]|uniref:hypothetical protein n=1 Tax=Teichococcus cervicalis TaxID=204525 RepID=UPI0022F159C7|nr:hypothetical protein [Pseudoroseomonas cervicalis]WBV45237.1 hypothetical protein PFY06_19540 [Pseudoroseomonas cervicalis]
MLTLESLLAERDARRKAELAEREAKAREAREKAAEERRHFDQYKITPEDERRIEGRIRKAFDAGEKEVMLGSFPSAYCTDGGRRINHALPGWEATLTGAAQRVHALWERRLQPGGFGFAARIISYPDGMPGDVGLFITWQEKPG